MQKVVNFKDLLTLEKPVYIETSEEFRTKLRKNIIKKYNSILNYIKNTQTFGNHNSLYSVLSNRRFTTLNTWVCLCNENNISLKELIKNTETIRAQYPKTTEIKPNIFPIKESPELAALIAHITGDGSLNKHISLSYHNTSKKLCTLFTTYVRKIIGNNISFTKTYHKANSFNFQKIVSDILLLAGAPHGNKTTNEFSIPKWILNGIPSTKKAFIRALYDDEGTIKVKSKEILIKFSKEESKIRSLYVFLNQLKTLLEEFNIEVTSIRRENIVKGKNGKTIQLILGIHGIINFKKFKKEINFNHPKKKRDLSKLINSYQRIRLKSNIGQKLILNNLNKPKTIYNISKELNLSTISIYKHLRKLEKKRLVKQEKQIYVYNLGIWRKI